MDFPNVSVFPGDFEFSGIVCNQLPLGIVNYILYRSFHTVQYSLRIFHSGPGGLEIKSTALFYSLLLSFPFPCAFTVPFPVPFAFLSLSISLSLSLSRSHSCSCSLSLHLSIYFSLGHKNTYVPLIFKVLEIVFLSGENI